jgi:hypothetical protein
MASIPQLCAWLVECSFRGLSQHAVLDLNPRHTIILLSDLTPLFPFLCAFQGRMDRVDIDNWICDAILITSIRFVLTGEEARLWSLWPIKLKSSRRSGPAYRYMHQLNTIKHRSSFITNVTVLSSIIPYHVTDVAELLDVSHSCMNALDSA